MTTTVSAVAQKGGVGKSTTVVGAALDMAARGLKVCLIDLDEQGSASGALVKKYQEMYEDQGPSSAYNLIKGAEEVEPIRVDENLYLLHASLDMLQLDNETIEVYFALKNGIQAHLQAFDVVLIDTPGTLKTRVVAALIASQWFYTPIELSDFSKKSVNPVINQFKTVKSNMNPKLEFAGMAPNRVHGVKEGLPVQTDEREFFEALQNELGANYMLGLIGERKYIRESLSKGKHLSGDAAKDAQKAADDIKRFTECLLSRIGIEA